MARISNREYVRRFEANEEGTVELFAKDKGISIEAAQRIADIAKESRYQVSITCKEFVHYKRFNVGAFSVLVRMNGELVK